MAREYTLNQVLQLAIGCPERGCVNFNILYCLLQLIIKRLEALRPLAEQLPEWHDFDTDRGHAVETAPREHLDVIESREQDREKQKRSPTYAEIKTKLLERSSPRDAKSTEKREKKTKSTEDESETSRRDRSSSMRSVKSILEKRSTDSATVRSKEALTIKRSEEALGIRTSAEAMEKKDRKRSQTSSKRQSTASESRDIVRAAKKQREMSSEEEEDRSEGSSKESARSAARRQDDDDEESMRSPKSKMKKSDYSLSTERKKSRSSLDTARTSEEMVKDIESELEEDEVKQVKQRKKKREGSEDPTSSPEFASKHKMDPGTKLPPIGKGALQKYGALPGSTDKHDPCDEDISTAGNAILMSKRSWLAMHRKVHDLEGQVNDLLKGQGADEFLSHLEKHMPAATEQDIQEMLQKLNMSRRIDMVEKLMTKLSEFNDDLEERVGEIEQIFQGHDDIKSKLGRSDSQVKLDVHHDEIKRINTKMRDLEHQCLTVANILQQLVSRDELQRIVRQLRDSLGVTVESLSQKLAAVTSRSMSTDQSEDEGQGTPTPGTPGSQPAVMGGTIALIMNDIKKLKEGLDGKMDKEVFADLSGLSTRLIKQVEAVKRSANFIETQQAMHEIQDETVTAIVNKLIEEGVDCANILEVKQTKEAEMKETMKMKVVESTATFESPGAGTTPSESMKEGSMGTMSESEESFGGSKSVLVKRVDDLERDMRDVQRKIERVMVTQSQAAASTEDAGQMEDAKMKILELFESVETLSEQISQLVEDNADKQKQLQKFSDALIQLNETKAEQEEVLLLKEEKADKMMVENKVDHVLFEASLNEVHQELAALEDKINYVDECNQTTLTNLSETLMRKVDRSEIAPLRDYINKKVKMLLIKIKKMQSVSGPEDAAGTRKQLLRKFHCVSCDKPVVVAGMGGFPHSGHAPFPPSQSTRPVTTYELELVRQQKRINMGKKCLFRPTASEMAKARKMELEAAHHNQLVRELGPTQDALETLQENVDTRYCGGSHTLTFPFQRVPAKKEQVDEQRIFDEMYYKATQHEPTTTVEHARLSPKPKREEEAEPPPKPQPEPQEQEQEQDEAPSSSVPAMHMLQPSPQRGDQPQSPPPEEAEEEVPVEAPVEVEAKQSNVITATMGSPSSLMRVRSSPGTPSGGATPRRLSMTLGGAGKPSDMPMASAGSGSSPSLRSALSRTGSGMQARVVASIGKMPSGSSSQVKLSGSASARSGSISSLQRTGSMVRSPLPPGSPQPTSRSGSTTSRLMQTPSRLGSRRGSSGSEGGPNQDPPVN